MAKETIYESSFNGNFEPLIQIRIQREIKLSLNQRKRTGRQFGGSLEHG